MFFKFKNHYTILNIILLIILSACQLQDPNKTHGIIFLENRSNKLILNTSNKNDVVNIMGQPQIKSEINQNEWIYLERTITKGKFHKLGKNILKDNNVLVLYFNKYGILETKEFLNKDDINQINFSQQATENDLSKKSFVQSFLESVKQKMYGNRKR
jgi:outer membrane protein assembly factor BamE (lipoprotein component of BamABCDE complex)